MRAIRVCILTGTKSRARSIEERLADDERIEILEMRTPIGEPTLPEAAEVAVVSGIDAFALTADVPVVYLAEESQAPVFSQNIRGWLPLRVSSSELIGAIEAASKNLTVLSASQAWRYLPNANTNRSRRLLVENLTDRELQVLRMLAAGLGNKEIAAQLGISDHTAKFHVAQILAKLSAGSRTEAVTTAIRAGLIPV